MYLIWTRSLQQALRRQSATVVASSDWRCAFDGMAAARPCTVSLALALHGCQWLLCSMAAIAPWLHHDGMQCTMTVVTCQKNL